MDKIYPTLPLALAASTLFLSACQQTPYPFGKLHCKLNLETPPKCPEVPVLETGTLEISPRGRFELAGRYNACFHIEDVHITGRTKLYKLHNGHALELLGTRFEKTDGSLDEFPRTIGFIHLDDDSLQGRFVDLWAMIRSHGQSRQKVLHTNLRCSQEDAS